MIMMIIKLWWWCWSVNDDDDDQVVFIKYLPIFLFMRRPKKTRLRWMMEMQVTIIMEKSWQFRMIFTIVTFQGQTARRLPPPTAGYDTPERRGFQRFHRKYFCERFYRKFFFSTISQNMFYKIYKKKFCRPLQIKNLKKAIQASPN